MCHLLLFLPIFALPLFWLLPWEEALILYSAICLLSAFVYWLLWGTMRQPVATGIEGMIGGTGTMLHCGEGNGKVFYRGEIWDAIGVDAMSAGEQVEIIGLDRMKIVVRKKP